MNLATTTAPVAAPTSGSSSFAVPLKTRFDSLHARRMQKIHTAIECAKLTIPALFPEYPDQRGERILPVNYNSVGARAVHNLASKVMIALFPPSTPFYKLTAEEAIVQQIAELDAQTSSDGSSPGLKTQIEEKLSILEGIILNQFERKATRAKIYQCLSLMIVTGDALIRKLKDRPLKVYNLHNYVVTRDGEGEWTELITKEVCGYRTLPDDLRKLLAERSTASDPVISDPLNAVVELYTVVERESENRYRTWQEIGGIRVPGSEGSYDKTHVPYLVLRWSAIDGEDYGRGMVEDYRGALRSIENHEETMDKITRACGKIIPMVNPNGVTKPEKLNRAKDGEFVYGNPEEVRFFTVDKLNDFTVISTRAAEIRNDIKAAFLMNSVVQRSGERVTAEEIRTVAAELEEALGGVYSVLSQEFQLPLVNLLYEEAKVEFRKLGNDFDLELGKELRVQITTGIDAIGRGNDANKLRMFIAALRELGDPSAYSYLVISDFIKRLGLSYGVDMKGLVLTEEQYQEKQQMAQQTAMREQLVGAASQAIPGVIESAVGGVVQQ